LGVLVNPTSDQKKVGGDQRPELGSGMKKAGQRLWRKKRDPDTMLIQKGPKKKNLKVNQKKS